MESVKTLIIGAGAIGLAIGYELSKTEPDLVIVDKESGFGRHTSCRNSEVIHAGHYYDPGSLKARFCVQGNALLYEYLEENSIPYKNTGKIIVATTLEEEYTLKNYIDAGTKNGCKGMKLLTRDEVCQLEPQVKCISGLFIPSSGIFDTHKYMQSLSDQIEAQGAFIVYGMEVTGISQLNGRYLVEFTNGEVFQCDQVINSAGLWSHEIAKMAGLDTEALGIEQHWCKGEYYKTSKINGFDHLVYPVADPRGIYLGIHLTVNLAGEVRFGPNAYYVDKIDYHFDEQFMDDFHRAINRYMEISAEDIMPDDTGIRAKLQGPDDGFRDFYIREESGEGLPGFVNLIGMESPGLTSSLAIALYVAKLIRNDQGLEI